MVWHYQDNKKSLPRRVAIFAFTKLLASAGDLSSDFSSEVVNLLLDAFALDEVHSVNKGDLAAQLLGSVGNVTGHVALEQVGADELLLQQAGLLVESSHLALSDLFLDLSGLGSHLGIVVHQSNLNSHFLVNVSLGNLSLVPVLGGHSSDLHSDVLAHLGDIDVAFHSQVDQNTVGAAGVNVSDGSVLGEADEAADLHVLANGHDLLLHDLGDGQGGVGVGAGLQSFHVSGVLIGNADSQVLNQIQEGFGLGSEVGLGVDFDDNTNTVHDGSVSNAFSSNAVSLLGSLGQALFTQPVNGLVHIAVGSLESLLAVHHADVGHFTESLNVLCGKSHNNFLLNSKIMGIIPRRAKPHVGILFFEEIRPSFGGLPHQSADWFAMTEKSIIQPQRELRQRLQRELPQRPRPDGLR